MLHQTVKKVRNRQNRFAIQRIFALWILFAKVEDSKLYSLKTSLLRKNFDLLRNSRPTVPMYADERELLVFRTFSQSVSVPKRVFRHADGARRSVLHQTVKKVRNRQNRFTIQRIFYSLNFIYNSRVFQTL